MVAEELISGIRVNERKIGFTIRVQVNSPAIHAASIEVVVQKVSDTFTTVENLKK